MNIPCEGELLDHIKAMLEHVKKLKPEDVGKEATTQQTPEEIAVVKAYEANRKIILFPRPS